jgi:6-phosphogluconolactonase (cycloisomerase 2 family)
VTNGSSTVNGANVTNVLVTCTAAYSIGYTVTGLTGSGLVLCVNYSFAGCNFDLDVDRNGPGTIDVSPDGSSNLFATGYAYQFKVETQPSIPAQSCVITNGSGTVGTADVTNVTVVCATVVGRFAYAANAADNTIAAYSIDSSTGALASVGSPVATGMFPHAIAASPDGMRVYVGNEVTADFSVYAVDVTSGVLTPIAGSPFGVDADPQALAFSAIPSGTYLYVADHGSNTLTAFYVNARLAPFLALATYATGKGPSAVTVSSDGKFVFVANNGGSNDISAFSVTARSGELVPVAGSPFPAGGNPHSLVLTPVGRGDNGAALYLYTANFDGTSSTVSGFAVDRTTGALTPLGGSPFPLAVSNYIATDRTGAYLYLTTGASVVGYRIDASTGLPTALAGFPIAAGTNAYSVTVDPSNQFVYVGNDGSASVSGYRLDASTGGLTPILGSPFAAGNRPDFLAIF